MLNIFSKTLIGLTLCTGAALAQEVPQPDCTPQTPPSFLSYDAVLSTTITSDDVGFLVVLLPKDSAPFETHSIGFRVSNQIPQEPSCQTPAPQQWLSLQRLKIDLDTKRNI